MGGRTGELLSQEAQRNAVLKAMQARTRELIEMSKGATVQPRLIQVALNQRAFANRFTGGQFAGFQTSCDFLPHSDGYIYGCFGTQFYQHNTRVCSVSQDWASGSVYETRAVADVVVGKLKFIATCKSEKGECLSGKSAASGQPQWNTMPGTLDADVQRTYDQRGETVRDKLDAEVDAQDETQWLGACLADPGFPGANPAK